jgi:Domain of Unknown Function with PDB structure (DUF3857)/Transglutaminase-like superfamily
VTYFLRRTLLFIPLTLMGCLPVFGATNWTQPTPDELKMTAEPKEPGTAAEYLNYEIISDEREHTETVYARIKILTEAGRDQFSDIHMKYLQDYESIHAVEGRTIHGDGTVIPFTGKPYDKEEESGRGYRIMAKVFTMPDVNVGSIVEYRYQQHLGYDHFRVSWQVQQTVFVRHAEFHFIPADDYGVQSAQILPPGVKVTGAGNGFDLKVEDIPGLPDEESAPPLAAVGYRVNFFYTIFQSPDAFWKQVGDEWSKDMNDVTAPSGKVKDAVERIVAQGDTDDQKLRKLYAAVMKLENTSFTRQHTRAEDKAHKIKIRTANDIWTAQAGDDDDIALLFVAMAKAAKVKAYAMYVTDRSRSMFFRAIPDWYQLDDIVVIAKVDGKDVFLDPGERYCEFGKLSWRHQWTGGIRQIDWDGSQLATTPIPSLADTAVQRKAAIQFNDDGTIHGTITVTMTGNEALHWRQEFLRTDEAALKKAFEDDMQPDLPPGVLVKTTDLAHVDDPTQPLVVTMDVTGSMGTKTGHRVFLPGTFFEAQSKAEFAPERRESPVYIHYPYSIEDQVHYMLPSNAAVESVPPDAQIPFASNGDFIEKYRNGGTTVAYGRRLRIANILYEASDYPALRNFFQEVSAQDQSQMVVKLDAAGTTKTGTSE